MREILFRALKDDMSDCKMVYGTIAYSTDFVPRIFEHQGSFLTTTCIKKTEGQFTGLLDKKGNKIFQGDVLSEPIQVDEEWTNSAIPVVWSDEKSAFCVDFSFQKDGSYLEYLSENCSEMEIIGNIHENPEFLTPC